MANGNDVNQAEKLRKEYEAGVKDYKNDYKAYQDVLIRYSKVLDVGGLNVADPIFANAFYYNKSGLNLADPPQSGKSLVFITRPDCNWAKSNINAVPWFDWFFQGPLGRQCASMLTHPHRWINHSYATDDFPKQRTVIEKFWEAAKNAQNALFGAGADISKVNENDLYTEEVKAVMNEYKSKWIEEGDNTIQKQLTDYGNEKEFDFRTNKPPTQEWNDETWLANRVLKRYPGPGWVISKNYKDTILYTSPFIPLLSNHCVEVPGGRDYMLGSHETEGDYYGGRLNYPTGGGDLNASGEITLNFRDNYWSQIFYLFYTWVLYIDLVSRGEIMPRITNIWERVLDYTCSIYVFVLDKDQTTIKGWAKYTGCTPRSVPMGQIMHSDKGENDNWRNISIPFVYNHVEYMDPQIFMDFNFVAGTEYERKINPNFPGFNLWNSKNKKYTEDDIFIKFTTIERGSSGKTPERILRINKKPTGDMDAIVQEIGDNTAMNKQMPDGERITYNNHWNGYPMIENGRFVWKHLDIHYVNDNGSLENKEETIIEELRDQADKKNGYFAPR